LTKANLDLADVVVRYIQGQDVDLTPLRGVEKEMIPFVFQAVAAKAVPPQPEKKENAKTANMVKHILERVGFTKDTSCRLRDPIPGSTVDELISAFQRVVEMLVEFGAEFDVAKTVQEIRAQIKQHVPDVPQPPVVKADMTMAELEAYVVCP
jgi:hypothetical protein